MVFQTIDPRVIFDPSYDFETFFNNNLNQIVDDIAEKTNNKLEEKFPTSLVHQVFRNFTKCRELKAEI